MRAADHRYAARFPGTRRFGEMLGNDVSQLRRTIEPNRKLLDKWRKAGLQVMHTREGHRPDLTDLPPAKKIRGRSATCIGDSGPMAGFSSAVKPGMISFLSSIRCRLNP